MRFEAVNCKGLTVVGNTAWTLIEIAFTECKNLKSAYLSNTGGLVSVIKLSKVWSLVTA